VIELKIRGRGGQGAVVASEMLGRACFLEGKYPQSFSVFGGERRGAPVFAYLRVDESPILLKCQIQHPDHEIILDVSLMNETEIRQEIKPGGMVLINSNPGKYAVSQFGSFRRGLVNASAIARSAGLENNFNTAVLGAYVRLAGLVQIETLIETVSRKIPSKVDANLRALRQGYEEVKLFLPEENC
jgi:2-oxoacid:acceptor oxidoreductase gamma subunit (pyruvate/2-ketoisovalerate family)